MVRMASRVVVELRFKGSGEPLTFELEPGRTVEVELGNRSPETLVYRFTLRRIEGFVSYTIVKLEAGGKTSYVGRSTKPGVTLEVLVHPGESGALRLGAVSPRTSEDDFKVEIEVTVERVAAATLPEKAPVLRAQRL